MKEIKSAFNFVPLGGKIFFPEWVEKISQDKPFKDGLDGYFDVTLTAQTPVFVRNGHTKDEAEYKTGNYASAAMTNDGRYYLPATSVKGAVRDVLSVLSFGKLKVDKRMKFAEREWENKELYTIKNPQQQKQLCCGWLKRSKENNGYVIDKCDGSPYRINHVRIDEYFHTDIMRSHFSEKEGKINLQTKQRIGKDEYDPKTALYKYRLFKEAGIGRTKLKGLHFEEDNDYNAENQANRVRCTASGDIQGTIVFTGQPGMWKEGRPGKRKLGDGKFYEFVFPSAIECEIPLSKDEFEQYEFIYQDSEDWKESQKLLDGDGIPVFFRLEKKGGERAVKDFGLAFLYKLPYDNTPYELEMKRRAQYPGKRYDLADCIMGYIPNPEDKQDHSLKGRVHFSNFMSQNAVCDEKVKLLLSGPKASYYPLYIQQDGGPYKTYNDGQLAGFKRYYLRDNVWAPAGNPKIKDDQYTYIYPLSKGTSFSGRVYFHNLRPAELGALLSAVTFHSNSDCCHQIGQGKPYGYGRLAVSPISQVCILDREGNEVLHSTTNYMGEFESLMNTELERPWRSAPSIVELFTLASQPVGNVDQYKYMVIDIDSRKNEFVDAKKEMLHLKRFSQHTGVTRVEAPNLSEEFERNKQQMKEEELRRQKVIGQLKTLVENIQKGKQNIELFVKASDPNGAERMLTEVRQLRGKLCSDDSYEAYKDQIDAVQTDGLRLSDIAKWESLVAGMRNQPVASIAGILSGWEPSSPEAVFGKIKKTDGVVDDKSIEVIAEALVKSFQKKKMKANEMSSWTDETKFASKYKSLIAIIGEEHSRQVMCQVEHLKK